MEKIIYERLSDLEILVDSSEEDFRSKNYYPYENYLNEYNSILSNLHEFGLFENVEQIQKVPSGRKSRGSGITQSEVAKNREIINESKKLLHRVRSHIGPEETKIDTIQTLKLIFSKFHTIVRQLRDRYSNRSTLEVNDEYDVQDLLHVLLKIYFQDIRPEETTPSYAASSKRMDFLLKSEKVVIEVKKTRRTLTAKKVGEELLVDIATYSEHPDCNLLVCFIYDPEGIIGNPIGLENDLTQQSDDNLDVFVYIYPK
jgi:hypothetical protein